jgi:hypothetical protein
MKKNPKQKNQKEGGTLEKLLLAWLLLAGELTKRGRGKGKRRDWKQKKKKKEMRHGRRNHKM